MMHSDFFLPKQNSPIRKPVTQDGDWMMHQRGMSSNSAEIMRARNPGDFTCQRQQQFPEFGLKKAAKR
jgi:hypothetical protein